MRDKFNRQLDDLYSNMKEMGSLCQQAIEYSVDILITDPQNAPVEQRNIMLTQKVFEVDAEIDQKERDIENLCMKILLQQQPVASDLRRVSSALKMISDMERIGDQSSDIAELSVYITNCSLEHKLHIKEMSLATTKMVKKSIDSFLNNNIDEAVEVIADDDKVDQLFTKVKHELIRIISKNDSDAELCVDLLMVAKYLERIGDHATNIAEWVEYSITGTHRKNKKV